MADGTRGKPLTVRNLQQMKAAGQSIVAVTAYTEPEGRLCDAAGVDVVLVGDSLGDVVLGLRDTVGVRQQDMLRHTAAVARGVRRALLVADMPFLSYQTDVASAVRHAGALLRSGADAVKLEGGAYWAGTVRHLVESGIPVVGHLGFTPQSVRRLGGPRVQARDGSERARLLADAEALAAAGAAAVVLEMVPAPVAAEVTARIAPPTIGIGAGPACSGQVLVLYDIVGLSPRAPRFARAYADLATAMRTAVAAYADDVRQGRFPSPAESHDGQGWGQGGAVREADTP